MKTCVRYWLALLLVVVPLIGTDTKVAARSNSGKATAMPGTEVANGFPTPWPKKPARMKVAVPSGVLVANGFPTPWPKKPADARA